MDAYSDPTPIATVEQFKAALFKVRDSKAGISQQDLVLFRTHCRAPNYTITTQQLAKELGPNYRTANEPYGSLAHRVCSALGVTLKKTDSGEPHWWRTLAIGHNPLDKNNPYEWIMRPELVQALKELNWG
jgi:hypothetical protein